MANILLLSVYDNGNQLQHLAESLRKYTAHDAIHINVRQSYLDYDADVKLPEITGYKKFRELIDRVSQCDFFIFAEVLPYIVKDIIDRLHVYHKINPSNTIIRTAGSYITLNSDKLLISWIRENWMFAGPYSDWGISGLIGRIAPVDYICPVDKIPTPSDPDGVIRVCSSPTRKEKGGVAFGRVMDKITTKYDHVEKVLISGVAWKEALRMKSTCSITFDQFMLKHYANAAIESMYLGHVVLSDVRSWCRMIHPDLPVINVRDENALYSTLIDVIENGELGRIGAEGKRYVTKYHHPKVVAKQWDRLIEHVQSM